MKKQSEKEEVGLPLDSYGEVKELTLTGKELRNALAEIEKAEKNGFMYCEAVFTFQNGWNSHWLQGKYFELLEKAHPTNGNFDWGRGQDITKRYRFKNGKLSHLKK